MLAGADRASSSTSGMPYSMLVASNDPNYLAVSRANVHRALQGLVASAEGSRGCRTSLEPRPRAGSNSAHHECCTWCAPAPHHSFQTAGSDCLREQKALQRRPFGE
jgi:hypothetical protein